MLRRYKFWTAFIAALAVGSMGCVEDRTTLTIRKMLVPDSNCVATPGGDSFISMGTLDIALAGEPNVTVQYFLFPEVENNLVPTFRAEGVELNELEIIEARVQLDFGTIGAALDADTAKFRYPAFLTLAPGTNAAIQVLGIPAPTARVLASLLPATGDAVIVRIKLKFLYQFGEYERESHEIEFPVQVCNGCLGFLPLSEVPRCDSGLVPDSPAQGHGCNDFQDIPIDCCQYNGDLVCPAVDMSDNATL